ncbi:hypothetical protein D915_006844 [Fasciola hepatica]|uniref:glutathione transferase n=1 Tax=Fasciola hepatica TaxID=6192 RepID=A0A4E0RZH9_FASHE|nr:hypothetical protein D915_006844 [Fasciola hepatica]
MHDVIMIRASDWHQMTDGSDVTGLKYKLTDYAICGQAEPVRMIFHTAGIDYEEQLIEKDNWCVIHQPPPAERMPVLCVTKPNGDTVVYKERMAISRWLAMQYNLMGTSSSEYYLVEQMLSLCLDLEGQIRFVLGSDGERQLDLMEKLLRKDTPKMLEIICKAISAPHGLLVTGNSVTLGDLFLLHTLDQLHCLDPSILRSDYPILTAHRNAVYDACPRLVQYREKRPLIVI